jgi:hypothetical protein
MGAPQRVAFLLLPRREVSRTQVRGERYVLLGKEVCAQSSQIPRSGCVLVCPRKTLGEIACERKGLGKLTPSDQ